MQETIVELRPSSEISHKPLWKKLANLNAESDLITLATTKVKNNLDLYKTSRSTK